MFVILRVLKTNKFEEKLSECLLKMLPWVTVQNFGVRCAALATFYLLKDWNSNVIDTDPSMSFVLSITGFEVEINGNSKTLVDNLKKEPFFNDIQADDLDLKTVFHTLSRICGMPEEELVFETISVAQPWPEFLWKETKEEVPISEVFSSRSCLFNSLYTLQVSSRITYLLLKCFQNLKQHRKSKTKKFSRSLTQLK